MKRVILGLILILLVNASARAVEEPSVSAYNQAIDDIYRDLWGLRNSYPELENFSKAAIHEGTGGLKEIIYSHQPPSSGDDPYEFGFSLKVFPSDHDLDGPSPEFLVWNFARLGIKVALEVYKNGPMSTFDPRTVIEPNIEELYLLDQDELPFRLRLKADKETFTVKESISITIALENISSQPFRVMDLNEQSLFCRIDGIDWGSKIPQDTSERVLYPNSSIAKVLKVNGISTPKEASISCRYSVGFKGIQPFDRIKVRIQPAS